MLGVPLGNSLRFCHGLIYCTQDDTLWRLLNEYCATAFKPQPLTDTHGKTHSPIRRDVHLESHVSFFA